MKIKFLLLCLLVVSIPLRLADAQNLLPNAQQVFLGQNGTPLALGFVYTYVPGTTTPKLTYQDAGLSVPNTNPIVLDVNGQARIWGAGQFRQVVNDFNGTLVWDQITQSPGTVTGPSPTTVGRLVSWGNTSGTVLAADPLVAVNVNNLDLQPNGLTGLSTLNSLYLPTYSQQTAVREILALSGTVPDSPPSLRSAFSVTLSDSDSAVYLASHSDYAAQFATFGPYSAGSWQTSYKNLFGIGVVVKGATSGTNIGLLPPPVVGVFADATQQGAGYGIGGSFSIAQTTAGDGALLQSKILAGVQGTVSANFAASDATHTAVGVMASNISSVVTTAAYGYSGTGQQASFMDAQNAKVTINAIVMPHSEVGVAGSIINYGFYNGNPLGGSYSYWDPAVNSGEYGWIDAGSVVGRLSPGNGFKIGTGLALATNAVTPFIYLTTMAGTPTGVPAGPSAGSTACVFDSTAHKMWCYDALAVAWKFAQFN